MAEDTKLNGSGDATVNRRKLLQLLGATGVAGGFAGCQSSGNGNNGSGDNGSSANNGASNAVEYPDRNYIYPKTGQGNFQNLNWNFYGKNAMGNRTMYKGKLFKRDLEKESLVPWLAEYEVNDDTLRVSFVNDELEWSNGDPITAKDLAGVFVEDVNEVESTALGPIIGSLEIVGKNPPTVEMKLIGGISNQNLELSLNDKRLEMPWDQYGKFLEKLWHGSKKEAENALEARAQFRVNIDEVKASGFFEPEEERPKRVVFSRNENFRYADKINFSGLVIRDFGAAEQQIASMNQGGCDYIEFHAAQSLGERIKNVQSNVAKTTFSGAGNLGLVPQHLDEQLSDLTLRKAIAYVLDRKEIAGNCGYFFNAAPLYTGTIKSLQKKYIGKKRESFTQYGKRSKPDKAAEVLHQGGYTKKSGKWYDPNGKRVNTDVMCKTSSYWPIAGRTAAEQLRTFGFDASPNILEDTTFWSRVSNGEFNKLFVGWWGHGDIKLPYYQYFVTLLRHNPGLVSHWGLNVQDGNKSPDAVPMSETSRAPMPIGNQNGDFQTVQMTKKINKLFRVSDEEKISELMTVLGWTFNQYLHSFPMINGTQPILFDSTEWKVPDLSAEPWNNMKRGGASHPQLLWRNGALQAKK